MGRELHGTDRSQASTRWAVAWATIALVLGSMTAAVTWAYKAHMTQQQAALTIGSAVFLGGFVIAGVIVRISFFGGSKASGPEMALQRETTHPASHRRPNR